LAQSKGLINASIIVYLLPSQNSIAYGLATSPNSISAVLINIASFSALATIILIISCLLIPHGCVKDLRGIND
jgi:hypothetical protein